MAAVDQRQRRRRHRVGEAPAVNLRVEDLVVPAVEDGDRHGQAGIARNHGGQVVIGGDEVGSAEEELPCELEGAPLTIAFNPGYLLDALGVLHVERASLTFTTPNRPALVRPVPPAPAEGSEQPAESAPGYLHLLMPVRLPG